MAGTQEGHSQSELKLDVGTGPPLISRREVIIRAKDQSPLCLFQKNGLSGGQRHEPAFKRQISAISLYEPEGLGNSCRAS